MNTPLLAFFAYLLVGNAVGYLAIVRDKRAARRGGRRRPEDTFSLLALLGWWPGMVLAMRQVRHKTRKRSFQVQLGVVALFGTLLWIVIGLWVWGLG